jgi:hypothetical protein
MHAFYLPIIESTLRHVVALCPVLLYLTVLGLREAWVRGRYAARRKRAHWTRRLRALNRSGRFGLQAAAVGLAVWGIVPRISLDKVDWPTASVPVRPGYMHLAQWMRKHLVEEDEGAFRTEWLVPNNDVRWLLREKPRSYNVPDVKDLAELNALADELSVRYLIIDFVAWKRRRHVFSPYIRRVGARTKVDLPGWKVRTVDPDRPASYVVYERVRGHRSP